MPNGSEKLRIAHDLHDGVVQDLAALGYAIDSVIGNPSLTPQLRSELREIRLESSRITAAFRNEVLALLDDQPEISTLIKNKLAKFGIEFYFPEPLPQFASKMDRQVKKLILEIVNNCIAHASATKFSLTFKVLESEIEITLQDDGKGGVISKPEHLGLSSIEIRALELGASIERVDTPKGVTYILLIPVN